jgi:hypothetical protein
MKELRQNAIFIGVLLLIFLLIESHCENQKLQKDLKDQIAQNHRDILKADRTKKDNDGQYSKLVDFFKTQKELNQQLKEQNKQLYDRLTSQGERLLMINNSIISLRDEISQGDVEPDPIDSNIIKLDLKYPNSSESFINWNGKIDTKNLTYLGEWKFGKLPLQVILTETSNGMWSSKLIGPNWLIVDSMTVNSLPPSEIAKPVEYTKLGWVFGGGYSKSLTDNQGAISVGGGLYYKNNVLVLNAMSNNYVGLHYYYRFVKEKKK